MIIPESEAFTAQCNDQRLGCQRLRRAHDFQREEDAHWAHWIGIMLLLLGFAVGATVFSPLPLWVSATLSILAGGLAIVDAHSHLSERAGHHQVVYVQLGKVDSELGRLTARCATHPPDEQAYAALAGLTAEIAAVETFAPRPSRKNLARGLSQ